MQYSRFLIFLFLVCSMSVCYAQKVRLENKYDERSQEYKIYSFSEFNGSQVIDLKFDRLINLTSSAGNNRVIKTIQPGMTLVTTLKRVKSDKSTNFSYKSSYTDGCARSKVKSDYPYLLPIKPHKSTQINTMWYLGTKFNENGEPKDWYSITIKTEVGDTIFAARRGRVSNIIMNGNGEVKNELLYSRNTNRLTIEHKDCSLADYALFQDGGIWVEEGQVVEAGDPLGIIGGKDYANGSHLRFSVRYYFEQSKETGKNFLHAYIPVKFEVAEGVQMLTPSQKYESIHNFETIKKEMPKRQIRKRFGKQNK